MPMTVSICTGSGVGDGDRCDEKVYPPPLRALRDPNLQAKKARRMSGLVTEISIRASSCDGKNAKEGSN